MTKLKFDSDSHEYRLGSKKLISVTQLINKYTSDFDADEIVDKMFEKSADNNIYVGPKREYIGMTKEQIKTVWDINRISKSSYGTWVHDKAEMIGNGDDDGTKTQELAQVRKFFKTEGYNIVSQELRIFSSDLGVAGTVDLLLEKDGIFHIEDWKTNIGKDLEEREPKFSKHLKAPLDNVPETKYWIYALQMSIYRYILEYQNVYNPEELGQMYIVHIIGSKNDLKVNGRHVVYPEMSRVTYKKIPVPYLKNEVKVIFEELKDDKDKKL